MPYWDRFDICEAYLAIEMDWNEGGLVDGKSYSSQLYRIGFKASPLFKGFKSLSENGKDIYLEKIKKLDYYKFLEYKHTDLADVLHDELIDMGDEYASNRD